MRIALLLALGAVAVAAAGDKKKPKADLELAGVLEHSPEVKAAVAKVRQAQTELDGVRQMVVQRYLGLRSQTRKLQAEMRQAMAELNTVTSMYDRKKALARSKAIPSIELDRARNEVVVAEGKVVALKAEEDALREKMRVMSSGIDAVGAVAGRKKTPSAMKGEFDHTAFAKVDCLHCHGRPIAEPPVGHKGAALAALAKERGGIDPWQALSDAAVKKILEALTVDLTVTVDPKNLPEAQAVLDQVSTALDKLGLSLSVTGVRGRDGRINLVVKAPTKKTMTVGQWLEVIRDSVGVDFVVREYGFMCVPSQDVTREMLPLRRFRVEAEARGAGVGGLG